MPTATATATDFCYLIQRQQQQCPIQQQLTSFPLRFVVFFPQYIDYFLFVEAGAGDAMFSPQSPRPRLQAEIQLHSSALASVSVVPVSVSVSECGSYVITMTAILLYYFFFFFSFFKDAFSFVVLSVYWLMTKLRYYVRYVALINVAHKNCLAFCFA